MNVLFSFKQLRTLLAMLAMMIFSFPDAVADAPSLIIKDLGEGHCLVQINTNQRYLLLPVEEVMPDVRVSMIVNNKEVKAADVRLAVNRVDYFVPLDLSGYTGKNVLLKFKLGSNDPVRGKLSAVLLQGDEVGRYLRYRQPRKVPSHLSLLTSLRLDERPQWNGIQGWRIPPFLPIQPLRLQMGKYELGTCYQQRPRKLATSPRSHCARCIGNYLQRFGCCRYR